MAAKWTSIPSESFPEGHVVADTGHHLVKNKGQYYLLHPQFQKTKVYSKHDSLEEAVDHANNRTMPKVVNPDFAFRRD